MISHHETLEDGDVKHRCQVVRWVRSFPFSFLSDREYIIGRRVWRAEDGCLYGKTPNCASSQGANVLFELRSKSRHRGQVGVFCNAEVLCMPCGSLYNM